MRLGVKNNQDSSIGIVIISTLDGSENIVVLLKHLKSLDENLELFVSDAECRDGTAKLAACSIMPRTLNVVFFVFRSFHPITKIIF